MKKKIFTVLFIIVVIISISTIVYFVNAGKDENNLKEKAEEELKYIGNEIIDMMNGLNNITFNNSVLQIKQESKSNSEESNSGDEKKSQKSGEDSKQEGENSGGKQEEKRVKYSTEEKGILNSNLNEIDWTYLKDNSEKLYSIWTTSIIDLHSLNVNNEDILNCSNLLDLVTLSAKNEDKQSLLNNLSGLYSYIPKFLEQIQSDGKRISKEVTKTNILNSYVFVEYNNWNEARNSIQEGINSYMNILNSVDENSTFSANKVTKIYVLLNELIKSSSLNDKEIYLIKYKNVMNELVNL